MASRFVLLNTFVEKKNADKQILKIIFSLFSGRSMDVAIICRYHYRYIVSRAVKEY